MYWSGTTLRKIPVSYQGKNYIMIVQYTSGFCEIVEEGDHPYRTIKLVHISELKIKEVA
jgi:hypothetical protein